ncbi:Signal recognition particle receptor FtsY [Candidatus Bealeia paramacronuclearis]|uniref:Signal recognition particle receptor FtsY n=1 Tax=Candidatus Bealeia paramacronuclearis TaxID=1921001 RepID=A0ABZ2C373_9PROT|nr:Signal recognition particle receptor FtsY [Candidatus Bealeia paramacronuclearis]
MTEKMSWFGRLKAGLQKSTEKITSNITAILTHRKLDQDVLNELEELLITSDLGVQTASELVKSLAKKKFNQNITDEEVRTHFADEIEKILEPYAQSLEINRTQKPFVVLVVGVNGTGKTTTLGKMAKRWKDQGYQLSIVAGDTFRAAAVEQLEAWGKRAGVPVIKGASKSDAAGLVYGALEASQKNGDDILLIDTAGRLHNKSALMDELKKVHRVIQKIDPSAPHATLLVLDATTGQNALTQVEIFKEAVDVSGLIITKLDGTAKGGVVVPIAHQYKLPIHAVGVGEGVEDLNPFSADIFAKNLMGIS